MTAASGANEWRERLRAAALRWLAQREHTRVELRAKLLRQACRGDSTHDDPVDERLAFIDALLGELQARGWQSDTRRAEGLVRTKAPRWGDRRLRQVLQRSGLDAQAADTAMRGLPGSELERARDVWRRRFGEAPVTPADRARQARFLAGRGFSPEVVRRVVRGLDEDPAE